MNKQVSHRQLRFLHDVRSYEMDVYDIVLEAEIAQLEERETEVLKVAGSIPAFGNFLFFVDYY